MHPITLKHLLIEGEKCIGLQFKSNKVADALLVQLPNPKWSDEFGMHYVVNTKDNLNKIFHIFKGVAWINCQNFFPRKVNYSNEKPMNVQWYRDRHLPASFRRCPEEYLLKLELKKYSMNTVKSYVTLFERFLNHFHDTPLNAIDENDIREYLRKLIHDKKSDSYINCKHPHFQTGLN